MLICMYHMLQFWKHTSVVYTTKRLDAILCFGNGCIIMCFVCMKKFCNFVACYKRGINAEYKNSFILECFKNRKKSHGWSKNFRGESFILYIIGIKTKFIGIFTRDVTTGKNFAESCVLVLGKRRIGPKRKKRFVFFHSGTFATCKDDTGYWKHKETSLW